MTESQDPLMYESLERGHEVSRVGVHLLLISGLGLLLLIGASFLLIDGVMRGLHALSPPAPPVSPDRAAMRLPAGMPGLEVDQAAELNRVLARQRKFLDGTAWVDQRAGIARISIDEAMAITAKLGLPAIQSPPAKSEAKPDE